MGEAEQVPQTSELVANRIDTDDSKTLLFKQGDLVGCELAKGEVRHEKGELLL